MFLEKFTTPIAMFFKMWSLILLKSCFAQRMTLKRLSANELKNQFLDLDVTLNSSKKKITILYTLCKFFLSCLVWKLGTSSISNILCSNTCLWLISDICIKTLITTFLLYIPTFKFDDHYWYHLEQSYLLN